MKIKKGTQILPDLQAIWHVRIEERQRVLLCRNVILIDDNNNYIIVVKNEKDDLLKINFDLIEENDFMNQPKINLLNKNYIITRSKK